MGALRLAKQADPASCAFIIVCILFVRSMTGLVITLCKQICRMEAHPFARLVNSDRWPKLSHVMMNKIMRGPTTGSCEFPCGCMRASYFPKGQRQPRNSVSQSFPLPALG